MVEISLSGSGEGPEGAIPRGYSTVARTSNQIFAKHSPLIRFVSTTKPVTGIGKVSNCPVLAGTTSFSPQKTF